MRVLIPIFMALIGAESMAAAKPQAPNQVALTCTWQNGVSIHYLVNYDAGTVADADNGFVLKDVAITPYQIDLGGGLVIDRTTSRMTITVADRTVSGSCQPAVPKF